MSCNYPSRSNPGRNSGFMTSTPTEEAVSFPPPFNPELDESFTSRNSVEEQYSFSNVIRQFQQRAQAVNMLDPNETPLANFFTTRVEFTGSEVMENSTSDSVVVNLTSALTARPEASEEGGSQTAQNGIDDSTTSNTDSVRSMIEAQQSLQFLLKYLPFALILLSKAIYDHCEGIFNLIILCATFIHANSVVKREATAQARRSLCKLYMTLLYIFACFAFIAYVFEEEKLYLNVVFIPPHKQPSTAWDLLWATGLTDFILKLITIVFKIILTIFPGKVIPFPKRGKIYLFIESVSQLYRSLATIQPWLFYLLESYQGAEKIVGVFLSAAYMVSKGTDLMIRLKLFKTSLIKLIQNVALGTAPSKEQMQSAGNQCPICHDLYDSPVLLPCRHIFCEGCVSTWFDREKTCPLCRATIVDDPAWRDGATTFFIQLF